MTDLEKMGSIIKAELVTGPGVTTHSRTSISIMIPSLEKETVHIIMEGFISILTTSLVMILDLVTVSRCRIVVVVLFQSVICFSRRTRRFFW